MRNNWLVLVLGLLHLSHFVTSQILLDNDNILNSKNDSSSGDVLIEVSSRGDATTEVSSREEATAEVSRREDATTEVSSREDVTTEFQSLTTDTQNKGLLISFFLLLFLKKRICLRDTAHILNCGGLFRLKTCCII